MGVIDHDGRYRTTPRARATVPWGWVIFVLLMMFVMSCFGCATAPNAGRVAEQTDDKQTTVHAMRVNVNGQLYFGTGVLPIADSYDITVFPTAAIERIVWGSCHQQRIVDRPSTGWKNAYQFTFTPDAAMETSSSCALRIAVVNSGVESDLALFEFRDRRPEVLLTGRLKCNGDSRPYDGVSICQSAAGLTQQIAFSFPVLVPPVDGCPNMIPSEDLKTYNFATAPGECTFYFTAQARAGNGRRLLHRLKTLGYTNVPALR